MTLSRSSILVSICNDILAADDRTDLVVEYVDPDNTVLYARIQI